MPWRSERGAEALRASATDAILLTDPMARARHRVVVIICFPPAACSREWSRNWSTRKGPPLQARWKNRTVPKQGQREQRLSGRRIGALLSTTCQGNDHQRNNSYALIHGPHSPFVSGKYPFHAMTVSNVGVVVTTRKLTANDCSADPSPCNPSFGFMRTRKKRGRSAQ